MFKVRNIMIVAFLLAFSGNVYAKNMNSAEQAMNIAESSTGGKALGARYVDKGSKKGYRVRIIKNGKVRHMFVPLRKLR